MEPVKDQQGVVDLLDVLLDEGVIIDADIVISVAEVPLVGINLQAAVAGMTTMEQYGMFEEYV
ncbi:MAG: gas vesicle protein [Halobacteria archaeon]